MICKHCGEDLTGKGLLAWATHPCNATEVSTFMSDGEIRIRMIELGFPKMVFECFNFAVPTEMERTIFEEPKEEQPYVFYMGYELWKNINGKS